MKKGITLIALVITIIVLLILAGVTLITLMGDNGILNQTTTSKEKTNVAQIEEELQLAIVAASMDYHSSGIIGNLSEWTQEAKDTNGRTWRGGGQLSTCLVGNRYALTGYKDSALHSGGSRLTLYIN